MTCYVTSSAVSCGVFQVYNLSNVNEFLSSLRSAVRAGYRKNPFYLFSDTEHGPGTTVAMDLKEFGNVIATESKLNPNSGNHIILYIFEPDWSKVMPPRVRKPAEKKDAA